MSLHIVVPETRTGNKFCSYHPDASVPEALSRENRLVAIADRLATEHRHVSAGAELGAFADSEKFLFVVIDGWMFRNAILEDGRRQILDFILPGDFIAGRRQDEAEVSQTVDAITDSVVAIIPVCAVDQLIAEMPSLAMTMLEASQSALYASYENLVDAGRRTSIEAVAHFLMRMEKRAAQAIGQAEDGAVPFPLIQEQIGDAIGLTAVHVCRTLRKLKNAGAIEMGRGWLKITDRQLLAEFAGAWSSGDVPAVVGAHRLAS